MRQTFVFLRNSPQFSSVSIDQVYHEVSATRSRTLFDLIFWLEDHFGSHKNFGSRGLSAAFVKYEQLFNSGGKHELSELKLGVKELKRNMLHCHLNTILLHIYLKQGL